MRKMILVNLLFIGAAAQGAELTLNGYLDMVRDNNQAYQTAAMQAEGAQGLVREADITFAPQFFAEARTGYDEKLQSPAIFVYDRALTNVYTMGLSQQTRVGLKGKVTYQLTDTELVTADPALQGRNQFADGALQLELSMPLWSNGFGRSTRASEDITRQQALANKYASQGQVTSILNRAENAYWRLATALEQLQIEEHSLKSAENILSYVTNMNRKDLGDKADVLQANALVDTYGLQVQQAQTELRAAQREFNLYLNRPTEQSVPTLEQLNFDVLQNVQVPIKRPGDRFDVKSSEAQAQIAKATSTVAAERNKPNLDLVSSYTTYGQADQPSKAIDHSARFAKDGAYVGVRFSVPLNLNAQAEARAGARQNSMAAEKNLSYLRYLQDQEWTDLVQKMTDAKQTLKLSSMIEKAQKAKLDNERARLRQGRTTTYQVLLFEQDYNRAQAARIQASSKILNYQSQAKLYQASLEGGN
ncbi:MAG: TolC family protein [Bdellovibrionales bacterium]|nr:TolC family protein [Bdellovibrionales bacterium]